MRFVGKKWCFKKGLRIFINYSLKIFINFWVMDWMRNYYGEVFILKFWIWMLFYVFNYNNVVLDYVVSVLKMVEKKRFVM